MSERKHVQRSLPHYKSNFQRSLLALKESSWNVKITDSRLIKCINHNRNNWLTLEPALSSPRSCLIPFARTNLSWLKGGQVYKYVCVNRFMSPCPHSKRYKHTPCTTCGSVLIHLSAWTIRETFGKHVQTFITRQSRWTASVLVVVGKTDSKLEQYIRGIAERRPKGGTKEKQSDRSTWQTWGGGKWGRWMGMGGLQDVRLEGQE